MFIPNPKSLARRHWRPVKVMVRSDRTVVPDLEQGSRSEGWDLGALAACTEILRPAPSLWGSELRQAHTHLPVLETCPGPASFQGT